MSKLSSGASNLDSSGGVTVSASKPSNWNLPNFLTSLRILLIPVFAWLTIKGETANNPAAWWAFVVFVLLMITDKLDGDIARAQGIVTDFGKIADPIADKALAITAFICLNVVGVLPWWVTIVITIREIGITVWRFFQLKNGNVVPASKGGKIKTALQSLSVGLLLCPLPDWTNTPTMLVVYITVAVTVFTGAQYIWDSFKSNG